MRAWLAVVLAACGASAPPPVAPGPPPPPPRDPAVAEPWTPPPRPAPDDPIHLRGVAPSRDEVILYEGGRTVLGPATDLEHRRNELWDPCVRELLESREPALRDALGDALTMSDTACDPTAHRATFTPPRRRSYAALPHLAFAGEVTPDTLRLELIVLGPGDRFTILAGGTRWTSPPLDGNTLPYTRSVAEALRRALDADDAVVRFGTEDVPLTDEMKRDLRMFADLSP